MTLTPTRQFQLEITLSFLLLHNKEDLVRSATEISADPEMARRVILALALMQSDAWHRAKRQPITDRPATVEELEDVLHRACAWASEVVDGKQP